MIKTKDIKNFKHISDPTEEKLNNLKLVSQETNKDIVSTQGELTKDILKARSIERLDALDADSVAFDDKLGEIETSVAEELTKITDRTESVISNSEKYKQDIEAFLSVAKGDDFLFFLDDCTRAVGRLDKLTDGSNLCHSKKITSWDIPLPALTKGGDSNSGMFQNCTALTSFTVDLPALTNGNSMFSNSTSLTSFTSSIPALTRGDWMFRDCTSLTSFMGDLSVLTEGNYMFDKCKLDLASMQCIADTINDLAAKNKKGNITIGMQTSIKDTDELTTALATIRLKGWTITEQYN